MSKRPILAALCAGVLTAALGTAAVPATATPPAAQVSAGSYVAVTPSRVLDTRSGVGVVRRPVRAHGTIAVPMLGRNGVPAAGVASVVLNVTVTQPKTRGYLSVFAAGTPRPAVSSVNFAAGQTVPNLVFAPVGAGGQVDFFNGSGATIQVLADVSGYYLAGTPVDPGAYVAVTPSRVLDTRSGLGAARGPAAPRATISLQTGMKVKSVVLNLTATAPKASGYLSVLPPSGSGLTAGVVNFAPGQTVANLVVAPVGPDGVVHIYNGSAGTTQVLADLSGYFLPGDTRGAGAFVPTVTTRLFDTRAVIDPQTKRSSHILLKAGQVLSRNLASAPVGADQLPNAVTGGIAGLMLNVTAVSPKTRGYVSVYAHGTRRPAVSNVNFVAGHSVANSVVAPWGSGLVDFYNGSGGPIDLVVDIYGYFRSSRAFDQLPPLPVRDVTVAAISMTSVTLTWRRFLPLETDLAGVMVRRQVGLSAPATPADGTLAGIAAPAATGFSDTSLVPGLTYSYSVFTFDDSGNYAARAAPPSAATTVLAWSQPQHIDSTGGHFTAVSCPDTTFCLAVDDSGFAFTYRGSSWAGPVGVVPRSLTSVSCATANSCLALDSLGLVSAYDGSSWSAPMAIDAGSTLTAVSCAPDGSCLAVDRSGGAFRYAAGTWSAAAGAGFDLEAVTCLSASFCLAAGTAGRVDYFNGTGWGGPVQAGPADFVLTSSVSCASTTVCVAVLDGIRYEQVAGKWTGIAGGAVNAVACDSSAFCVQVDHGGFAALRPPGEPPHWRARIRIDSSPVTAVSCPAAPFCMAVTESGDAISSS